jgi:MFS family permease
MLLEASGLNDRSLSILQFTMSYACMGTVTMIACWTTDRAGRRPMWMFASLLMAAVMCLTGVVFHFHLSGWVVLLVISLCTIPHGIALGPLPWLMISEIFPTRLRARAVSLTTAFLWLTIFSGAQLFPIMADYSKAYIGSIGGAFWICSIICVFSFFFGLKMLPETKGRSLEEIAASWKKRR